MKAKWLGKEAAALGPQRAAAGRRHARDRRGPRRATRCSRPMARSRPRWPKSPGGFFDGRWIDAPVRPGKAPGAFAHPTVPSAHPYVLLNYQGKPRDVMTLAHELGHGVHQVLAARQGPLMAPTPLTLAETASVFGEMLTFQALLTETDRTEAAQGAARRQGRGHDQHGRAADRLLYASSARCTTERKQGELTAERIGEIWLEVQAREPRAGDRVQAGLRGVLGATSRTSSIRRSTSTPMRSATAW